MKDCTKCHRNLPNGNFAPGEHRCRFCKSQLSSWRRLHYTKPEAPPTEYVTPERWEQTFSAQDGACAICRRGDRPLFIDHDHGTGRFRALLCSNCNAALGLLHDEPYSVSRALDYLLEHQEQEPPTEESLITYGLGHRRGRVQGWLDDVKVEYKLT